jgi:phage gpG-like protein
VTRQQAVDGVERLNALLAAVGDGAAAVVRRNVKRSLMNVEAGAKRRCRVRTGRTRNSITHVVDADGMDGQAGTNVEYAVHQHFGTGQRGQASAAEFGFSGGAYDLSIMGQTANPFMYLAVEEERPQFVSRLSEDLRKKLAQMRAGLR